MQLTDANTLVFGPTDNYPVAKSPHTFCGELYEIYSIEYANMPFDSILTHVHVSYNMQYARSYFHSVN